MREENTLLKFVSVVRLAASAMVCGIFALPIAGLADEADLLPFDEPLTWVSMAPGGQQPPVVEWKAADGSTLIVQRVPSVITADYDRLAASQGNANDPSLSVESKTICGRPVKRTAARIDIARDLATLQVQTIGDYSYITTYTRKNAAQADADIVTLVDTLCDPDTLAHAKPPAGWKRSGTRLIGTWFDASTARSTTAHGAESVLQLYSISPEDDIESSARAVVEAAVPESGAKIVSTENGTRCGRPSFEARGTAKTVPDVAKAAAAEAFEIRIAIAKSATSAYALVYAYPAADEPDNTVLSSMATLCAY